MSKEFFKNLPDTSTPLNASRLNGLFNGNESMGSIVVENVKCKNLFNKDIVFAGWLNYNDNSMNDTDQNRFVTSDYILVEPNTTYTLNLFNSESLGSGGIMFYDSEKNWLSPGIAETETIITFTTTSNTKYVRFVLTNEYKDNVQLEEGTTATEYTPYKKFGYNSQDSMGKIIVDDIRCKNLVSNVIVGDTTNWSVGQTPLFTESTTRATFYGVFIDISRCNSICASINSGFQFALAFCDSEKKVISNTDFSTNYYKEINEEKYVCIKIKKNDGSVITSSDLSNIKFQIEEGTTVTEYVPYKAFGIESGSNSNGNWVKFDDGTMMQWGTVTRDISFSTKSGATNWYYNDAHPVIFPQSFIDTDYDIDVRARSGNVPTIFVYSVRPNTASQAQFSLTCNIEKSIEDYIFGWKAIGRWK